MTTKKLSANHILIQEGWGFPFRSRKTHYFRGMRSLCAKWLYMSDKLEQDGKKSFDDCVICRRKRDKELAKALEEGEK